MKTRMTTKKKTRMKTKTSKRALMRYTPHTSADKERMLREIGCASIDDLTRHVPQSLRDRARIELPDGLTELEVRRRMSALAARNVSAADWSFFLGGGIYHHFIPSAVDATISRAEFSTSYTPYQPEVSQGTLQALFEYQTLICQLTGMEVSNAAVYDGASAVAEAVLMSRRIQPAKKRRVLMSRALHPQYRAVVATYLKNLEDVYLEELPFDAASGATDLDQLKRPAQRPNHVRAIGISEFFRCDRRAGADPGGMRYRRRPPDHGHERAFVPGAAEAAGRFRRRYRRWRGAELGRADESRRARPLDFLPARKNSSEISRGGWSARPLTAKDGAVLS